VYIYHDLSLLFSLNFMQERGAHSCEASECDCYILLGGKTLSAVEMGRHILARKLNTFDSSGRVCIGSIGCNAAVQDVCNSFFYF